MAFSVKKTASKVGKAVSNPKPSLGGALAGGLIGGPAGLVIGGLYGDQIGKEITRSTGIGGGNKNPNVFNGDRPEMSPFQSVLNQDNTLSDKYKVSLPEAIKAGNVSPQVLDEAKYAANQDALNAIKERAMSKGDSPWLKMQLEKAKLEELSARDRLPGQVMNANQQAMSGLAMRGGLSSGARERLAVSGARGVNAAQQNLGRDAAVNRLNLGVADDQTKMALLAQVPGMDLGFANQRADLGKFNIGTNLDAQKYNASAAQDAAKFNTGMAFDANKFNTANSLLGVNALNQFNAGKYAEDMKGYAAGMSGNAIAKGGKK